MDKDEQLFVRAPFVLRDVFDRPTADRHGEWTKLDERERDDVLAFLLSL